MAEPLTERELEVADLARQGLTVKEAAHALGISEHTVRSYKRSIYRKLGIHSLAQLGARRLPRPRTMHLPE